MSCPDCEEPPRLPPPPPLLETRLPTQNWQVFVTHLTRSVRVTLKRYKLGDIADSLTLLRLTELASRLCVDKYISSLT